MIVEELRKRIAQAVKEREDVVRDVLRLAVGEIQTAEARANRPVTDDEAAAIVRKLVKSNEETLSMTGEGPNAPTLRREIEVLSALLPKGMDLPQIVAALESQREAIRAAKNDGQATGLAMKHLKAAGAKVDGTDVAAAVKSIRA